MRAIATATAIAVLGVALGAGASPAAVPDDYRVTVPASAEVAVGASAAISLTIAARPGYTVSHDGPVHITLAVDRPGLGLVRTRYTREHAADARAADPRFDLQVKGEAAGAYVLTARVSFWICGSRTCRPVNLERAVAVTVAAPAASVSSAATR